MQEAPPYSIGYHARVFLVKPHEPGVPIGAQVRREEPAFDPYLGERLFLKNRLARTILPDNFIDIVGFQTFSSHYNNPNKLLSRVATILSRSTHVVYSRLADIPPEHAHMAFHTKIETMTVGDSPLHCGQCLNHMHFHRDEGLMSAAEELNEMASDFGFKLQFDDPTDYCEDMRTGHLKFFEDEDFSPEQYKRILPILQRRLTREQYEQALVDLARYQQIRYSLRRTLGHTLRRAWVD